MQEEKRGEPRPSPEMIEVALTSLLRSGAQARHIGRVAPQLGRWISEDLDDSDAPTPGIRWIHAEKRLRIFVEEEASPFYRERLLIMLAFRPGLEGTKMTTRAEAAARTCDWTKWEGVSWHHYRYRMLPDEIRGLADRMYERLVMEAEVPEAAQ
ncbi:hypothetical protein [Microbacterium alcoholitolerans]|uniref:hypothetical protein n=1 Tax=unclassified Microbacterium TaxID=2609290 RepID=UPI003D17C62A